jgi:putative FmdB family regulatory protein
MPLYEYVCTECDCRFEQRRKVTDRTVARCPRCNGRGKKVFGAVGIIFKGPGFYSTDNRKPEDKKAAAEDAVPVAAAKPKPEKSE